MGPGQTSGEWYFHSPARRLKITLILLSTDSQVTSTEVLYASSHPTLIADIWKIGICLLELFACWVIFSCFYSPLLTFSKLTFSKNCFMNTFRVSNGLDPDQDQLSVGPDLDPNCKQRLSADYKIKSLLARIVLNSICIPISNQFSENKYKMSSHYLTLCLIVLFVV